MFPVEELAAAQTTKKPAKKPEPEGSEVAAHIANAAMQQRIAAVYDWWKSKGGVSAGRWTPLHIARIAMPLELLLSSLESIWLREGGRVRSLAFFYVPLQELESNQYKMVAPDAERMTGGAMSAKELLGGV